MTRNDLPARTEACLDDASLRAYHLGTIPEALLDRVVNHLADCRRCESALEALRDADDAFLHNLRQYLRDTPHTPGDGAGETGPDLAARPRHPANVLAGLGTLPRPFGNYDVLENLAIGGMSFVFKARQRHPNRLVALKIPQCAPLPGTEAFQRFQREIEAIAQLQHDHIVRIYECGEEDGLPYFSMEYMEQGSLAARLAGSPLPEREAAQLVRTLARAMQFAHEHGIIHRDLKPANVLLGAEGAVKLTDFGLAKWLDGDHELTQSHAILGTAKYMAPEQARGDAKKVGVTTDVYGLGTILYECLTGRAPFRASSQAELLALVEAAPPVPPSKLRRGLCRNLEAICLKCLEKSPERRYASAERLANDLENWLNHQPTEARPRRWPARVYRTARRHASAILVAMALLGGLTAAGLVAAVLLGFFPHPDGPEVVDSTVYQTVRITTEPPGARVVLVPINQYGELDPSRRIKPAKDQKTPLTLQRVPVGKYLVVAEVPGYGFHEVHRIVPESATANTDWSQSASDFARQADDGSMEWPLIRIVPNKEAQKDMARFPGGDMMLGDGEIIKHSPPRHISPFYLDTTEVTVRSFKRVKRLVPAMVRGDESLLLQVMMQDYPQRPADFDDYAVRGVTFTQALDFAEAVGKRLPTEAEYEFAATNGGTQRFPWGNEEKPGPWVFGPAGKPEYDRTDTCPPVFGLYSNVAEWTDSLFTPYAPKLHPAVRKGLTKDYLALYLNCRVVRGAPNFVIKGRPPEQGRPADSFIGPTWRQSEIRGDRLPGVGFRCARSAAPRFLDD